MRKSFFLFSLFTAIILSFVGCSHEPLVPRVDFITELDNGKTVLIEKQGLIEIDLPGEAEGTSSWNLVGSLPSEIIQAARTKHKRYTDVMGSAGTTIFSFKTVAVGTPTLNFEYRDSSGSSAATDTFSVTLDIRERSF